MAAIQEQIVRVLGNFAAGCQSRDGHALKCDKTQCALSAVGKEPVPVPNGDETHGAVPLLQGRDPTKHLELTRAFPNGIARRPRRGPQDCDLIARSLSMGDRMQACGSQSASHP